MKSKLKIIASGTLIVALLTFVVYVKTAKKMNRLKGSDNGNTEQLQTVVNNKKAIDQKEAELVKQKEQIKRDSIAKIQKEELKVKLKKTQELTKKLQKEILKN